MNAKNLRQVIIDIQKENKAVGSFFSARNVTAKGERIWNCRLGVKKGDKGGEMPYDPFEHDLIVVWSRKRKDDPRSAKRTIKVSTLLDLQVCGTVLMKDGVPTQELTKRLSRF